MKMRDMRATLVAYVQPPGVTWVHNDGSSDMSHIYRNAPSDYRYAVVHYKNQYEVVDLHAMCINKNGWLVPDMGKRVFDDEDAAVASAVLLTNV